MEQAKKVLIETYGCTLNHADSRIMGALLKQNGFEVEYGTYSFDNSYDYVVMNTCTVKTQTEQKILDRVKKANFLGNKLIVAGCIPSASKHTIESVAPNSSIITTSNAHRIAEAIGEIDSGKRPVLDQYSRVNKGMFAIDNDSAIGVIPISEGCLSNCSFCETKFARGPLNSFPEELILKGVEVSLKAGAKEIDLTSQDTGAYGIDKKTNIAELVKNAAAIEGDFRIRVGMLNPEHLHRYFDDLVEAMKSEKVYKFVHLPIQSGSDSVLKQMKRNYTVAQFNSYVKEFRSKIPGISIATDIIVGFPNESDADFTDTLNFLKEMRPEIVNVSKFGARPHAPASKLEQLDNKVIKARSAEASRLFRHIQEEQRVSVLGEVRSVLITERNAKSVTGRDDFYNEIAFPNSDIKIGTRVNAKLEMPSGGCIIAELAK